MSIQTGVDDVVQEVKNVLVPVDGVTKEIKSGFATRGNAVYNIYGDVFSYMSGIAIVPARRIIYQQTSSGSSFVNISDVSLDRGASNEVIENVGEWGIDSGVIRMKTQSGYRISIMFNAFPIYSAAQSLGYGKHLVALLSRDSPSTTINGKFLITRSESSINSIISLYYLGKAPSIESPKYNTILYPTLSISSGYSSNSYFLQVDCRADFNSSYPNGYVSLEHELTDALINGVSYSFVYV